MSALVLITPPAEEPLTVAQVEAHLRIDASNQEPPPGLLTAAPVTPAAPGNVDNGAHRYLATFVTAAGETQAGTVSAAATVVDKTVNGKVALTGIPIGGALVTARNLYRSTAGGSTYLLLATIADNLTTTYTDDIADSALGVGAPAVNTTEDWFLNLLIRSARNAAESICRRALITQTWDMYLDHFPAWEQYIPMPTAQSIDSVSYVDTNGVTQTLDPSLYHVDLNSQPARITPAFGLIWPVTRWQTNAVTIRFTCGYGASADVPDGIRSWMLMRINTLWNNRAQIEVNTRITMIALPSEFMDGLLDNFKAFDFCLAADTEWGAHP